MKQKVYNKITAALFHNNPVESADKAIKENVPGESRYCLHKTLKEIWALQKENAPLREVLNGLLVSAPENLYDSYILREIQVEGIEFKEGKVIANILGKYRLGISDGWIALRSRGRVSFR